MKFLKNRNKSIALFLPRFHTNLYGIIDYLLKKNVNVKVFSFNKSIIENYKLIKPAKIPTRKIKLFNHQINFFKYFKLLSYLKNKKYNLIIIRLHDFKSYFLLPILLKSLNINFLFYTQTNLEYLYNLNSLKFIKYFIFLNFFKTKILTPVFDQKKIKTNKYFLPFPFLIKMKKQITKQTGYLKILCIAKYKKRKNILFLIKVLTNLDIKFKLIVIGEKTNKNHIYTYNEIRKFLLEQKLKDKVILKSNVKNKNINKYYNWCDFFVLPSTKEPAAISPLEALSFRKPVICSSNNGTKYYINHNFNGYIFDDGNYKSLRNYIQKMSFNYKRFQKNLNLIKDNFLNENILNKINRKILKIEI